MDCCSVHPGWCRFPPRLSGSAVVYRKSIGTGDAWMKKRKLLPLILLPTLLLCIPCLLSGCTREHPAPETGRLGGRTVTDMAGRDVTIPEKVSKVACLEVLGYEKLFLLGQTDKISVMYSTNAPWMEKTNPKVKDIPKFIGEPNFEELLNRKIDVAFFRYSPEKTLAKLTALGIPGIVSQPVKQGWGSAEEFQAANKKMLRLYGEVFGAAAIEKAEKWCNYYDERTRYVTQRTSKLPQAARPKVYYLRGPDALTTQGANSNTAWYGNMAGADMINKNVGLVGKGSVSMEDILRWNPEYIFVGRQYSTDLVLKDPRWRDIKAVREGKVYPLPEGVFYWDGSSEGVLLMEFLAKKLHPGLFVDLDMAKELKDYYARFYGYRLTNGEADKILNGLSPDGQHKNSFNN
jgi:iron complex transport system substrate-binding protein